MPEEALRATLEAQHDQGDATDQSSPGGWIDPTATIAGSPSQIIPPPSDRDESVTFYYITHPGDTLSALAGRFGVDTWEIISDQPLPPDTLLPPSLSLSIPNRLDNTPYSDLLLPDSEVVYSPSSIEFDIEAYIKSAGGFLSSYEEQVNGEWVTGVEIVKRVAADFSINPRLLLAFLEYRTRWVLGQPDDPGQTDYPLGFKVPGYRGLYYELGFAATQLNIGYYGWRAGTLTELQFHDQSGARLSPKLNPGTVALQRLFAKLYDQGPWVEALYGPYNFLTLYRQMYGDPFERATRVEPLLPSDMSQPDLELPFAPGERWSFTGGPHQSWNTGTPRGGLDFAPVTGEPACVTSRAWATASASGVVVRSANNVVVLDLDGDGFEQTGWVILYLHLAEGERVSEGALVIADEKLGHPSCERGKSTGTHVHIARKYNGEWIAAGGPLPFVLSGWQVEIGERNYEGQLIKGDQVVVANPLGNQTTIIVR